MEETKSSLKAHLWKFHKVVERSQISSLLREGLQSLSVTSASDQGSFLFYFILHAAESAFRQKADDEETVRKLCFKQTEFGSNVERPGIRNTFLRERALTSYHTYSKGRYTFITTHMQKGIHELASLAFLHVSFHAFLLRFLHFAPKMNFSHRKGGTKEI